MSTWPAPFVAAFALLADPADVGRMPDLPAVEEPASNPPAYLLDRIERQVRLPAQAGPLSAQRRYYAVTEGSASRPLRIVAIYTTAGAPAGRQWVTPRDLPMVFGGGCGWIEVGYSVPDDRIVRARCNPPR